MTRRSWLILLTVGQVVGLAFGVWWALDTVSHIQTCGDTSCITGTVREVIVPFIAKLTLTTALGGAIVWIAVRRSRRS